MPHAAWRLSDTRPGGPEGALVRSPGHARHWTPRRRCATIVAVSVEPLRAVRDHLSEVVDRVEKQHERVTITRHGRAAAVLISPDDLAELEETLSVLADPEALADIRDADLSFSRGDVLRGVDAVRGLRQ